MSSGAFLAPQAMDVVRPGAHPRFSVIIATWNAAGTIGEAVRSVLAQTAPPVEIVICDDGSTDDLSGALEEFGGRVRLLNRPRRGQSAAKNAAAAEATGDFVVILDADDTWLPRRLERLGALAAARPDLDVLTTDAWFEVDGRRTRTFYKERFRFPVEDQRLEILRRNFVFGHAAVRRSRWIEVGGFDESVAQGGDWDLWVRLLYSGSRIGCVGEPLAHYRIWGQSVSADRPASLRSRVDLLDRTAASVTMSAQERRVLAASRAGHLRRARRAEASAALVAGGPGARSRCLALAVSRGVSWRERTRAFAAVVVPNQAGRRLRSRQARSGLPADDRSSAS